MHRIQSWALAASDCRRLAYSTSKAESVTHDSLYGYLAFGEGMKDGEEVYDRYAISNRLIQTLSWAGPN